MPLGQYRSARGKSIRRILLALVLPLAIAPVIASDPHKQFRVRAIDAVSSCKGLTRALTKAKKQNDWGDLYGYSLYMMGYLTAVNRLAANTYDIGGKKNSKTLMVWLENHCAAHPNDSFDYALYLLTVDLYPNRTTVAPAQADSIRRD